MRKNIKVKFAIERNRRPKVEVGCSTGRIKNLLERGWARDPKVRPTIEFRDEVRKVYDALTFNDI